MDNFMKPKQKRWRRRALATALAFGLAAVCVVAPGSAFASDTTNPVPAADTTGYVTAAATRAAGPAPEILGISGVEESGQFVNPANWLNWVQPKYDLMATPYNVNPNPYFENLVNSLTPGAVLNNTNLDGRTGGGGGPNASLAAYNGADPTDTAIWALLPDIIIGNGGSTDYAASALAVGGASYQPTSLTYGFVDNAGLIDTMYSIAAAGDAKVTAAKTLRYGSATDIAYNYEKYIRGTKGYILEQLDDEGEDLKTVASIASVNLSGDYPVYTLFTTQSDGTASTNRYLETTEGVSINYATALDDGDPNTPVTVTGAQLLASINSGALDLILIGGQQGSVAEGDINSALTNTDGIPGTKVYYIDQTAANYQTAAMYGVVMNSVENAQNIGRILGVLYPEYVNQAYYLAYYFQTFYHITVPVNSGVPDYTNLTTVLYFALPGAVPNVNAPNLNTTWSPGDNDFSGYDSSIVQGQIDEGIAWLQTQIANNVTLINALVPTSYLDPPATADPGDSEDPSDDDDDDDGDTENDD